MYFSLPEIPLHPRKSICKDDAKTIGAPIADLLLSDVPKGSMYQIIGSLGFGVVQVWGKYMIIRYLDP